MLTILTENKCKMKLTYKQCLHDAKKKRKLGRLSLCPEGHCTAKMKFAVYPSAHANGYAVQVCKGTKPDHNGNTKHRKTKPNKKKSKSNLKRWFKEKWVNVCEKGKGPGNYKPCGSGQGVKNLKKYPYCRPYYKMPGTTVVTARELTKKQIKRMCTKKRSKKQGVDGKPTRVMLK
eukprot:jgi/Bigna1/129930/aug1.10_g4638